MSQAEFPAVTAVAKANVYFDGRVVSHTIKFADGSKKTLGLIYAGEFHFGTDAPERMDITAGRCEVFDIAVTTASVAFRRLWRIDFFRASVQRPASSGSPARLTTTSAPSATMGRSVHGA